jgi:hemolysin activation/secretion protein
MQAAPPGAAALSVTLKSIVVQGGLPQMEARTRTLLRPLEGRTITAADLFTAAHALEVDYAKAGYVLVRVTVPVQALNDGGVATLTVTDGVIESVQARSLPSRIRRRIMALLAPLIGRHAVKYDLIERQLLLASDTPGVALSSTLAPGAAPGASDLAVQAQYRPVDLPVTADNLMASNIGRTNLGLGADFNSIFGLGELIYLRANGDPGGGGNGYFAKDPRDRALAGGLAAPLGRDGLTLDFEVSESAATPAPEPGALGVTSRFDRLSFRARYPWIRSRALNVNSELTFDVQRDALYGLTAAPEGLSLDRLRIARLSGEAAGLAPFGATFDARVTGSFGIDALGARSPAEATPELPLSRQGVNPSFQKLEAALAYHQPFRPHLAADLTFKAQSSFNEPMANSEQFGMVGPQALSGFDAGEFEGDSGAVARAELTSEWTVRTPPGGWGLTPYLFAADGEVHDVRPTAVEYAYTHAAAYGFGLHTQFISAAGWGRQAFTVEFARDDRGDRGSSSDRVSLIASAQF